MVAQSPEPGAHVKNARLFTITILLLLTKFTKTNPDLKLKTFLKASSPKYIKQTEVAALMSFFFISFLGGTETEIRLYPFFFALVTQFFHHEFNGTTRFSPPV